MFTIFVKQSYRLLMVVSLLMLQMPSGFALFNPERSDTDLDTNSALVAHLTDKKSSLPALHFSRLTREIYRKHAYNCLWFLQDNDKMLTEAFELLERAHGFGLNPADFHPTRLTRENLQIALEAPAITSDTFITELDILLTDAILTFIAHLHFGKFNPVLTRETIDNPNYVGFRIDAVLIKALSSPHLITELTSVQPKHTEYRQLQKYLESELDENNSNVSDSDLLLVAVNMERHRWYSVDDSVYVDINIPAFTLKFNLDTTEHLFKIIVGTPASRTPTLKSKIRFFTTAPDWYVPSGIFRREILPKAINDSYYLARNNMAIYNLKGQMVSSSAENLKVIKANPSKYFARQSSGCDNALGKIVFNFKNAYSVYLHDTARPDLFNDSYRALSHGCIRLQNPEKFVELLLKYQGVPNKIFQITLNSMKAYKRFKYTLPKPVTISIRYITCKVKEGVLIKYPDVYQTDASLMSKLLN